MDAIVASFGLEEGLLRGFVFGLVHVGILIIGYYSGWSINRLLKITSNGHIAGIVGAAMCLYYLFLFLRNISLRVLHIMVGDYEYIENYLNSYRH